MCVFHNDFNITKMICKFCIVTGQNSFYFPLPVAL